MRLLLDTHIALWAIADDAALPGAARAMIADLDNEIFVSAASIWEIAIKHALARGGPNDMPVSGSEAAELFVAAGFTLLPITAAHAAEIENLPPHHPDPFDRLLIAQARLEPLHLLTHDSRLPVYGKFVMRV